MDYGLLSTTRLGARVTGIAVPGACRCRLLWNFLEIRGRILPMAYRVPPKTRYQGSKRKLLSWIDACIGDRPVSSALDLMSGTASVAYYFKAKGWKVASNDYLRCNYLTAAALVENSAVTLSNADIEFLLSDPPDDSAYRFIRRTFQGYFFTPSENAWVDRRIARIEQLGGFYKGNTLKYKRALAFHALSQAALMKRPFNLFHRRNLNLRINQAERSFGNKTTWDTPFHILFRRLCKDANEAVFSNGMTNRAYNKPAERLQLREHFDLVYLDPPYFAEGRERARSDYRLLYHFLEGMARYRDWPNLVDQEDTRLALRRNYNRTSPFRCTPAELNDVLLDWFRSILARWKDAILVLSYKSPGIPSARSLRQLMLEYKPKVTVHRKPYTYALSKKNGLPRENIELLIVGE